MLWVLQNKLYEEIRNTVKRSRRSIYTYALTHSSCSPYEYLFDVVKWRIPQRWRRPDTVWLPNDKVLMAHGKMKLPHWRVERLLLPSSTHTWKLWFLPLPPFLSGHREEQWGNKYINIEIKSESNGEAPRFHLWAPVWLRNGCQDINFHDVRNLEA